MSTHSTLYTSILTLCFTAFLTTTTTAQHYEHTTFWGRIMVATPLSKKWDLQLEYTHRSQNNYRESMWNPFAHETMEQSRLWINYKQKGYTVLLNPISFGYSFPLLGKEADFNAKPNIVWQSVVGIEGIKAINQWILKGRAIYEFRAPKSLDYLVVGRVRFRALVQYKVTPKTKLMAYSDNFFNVPPHKLTNNFDQSWNFLGFSHTFTPKFTLDLGVMRNHRQRANGFEFDEEKALNCMMNFRL
jgi:hypothetical protein